MESVGELCDNVNYFSSLVQRVSGDLPTMYGCCMILLLLGSVLGHGRLRNPAGRSTMWRYDFDTPHNVNDHETNCGGFGRQWHQNDGKLHTDWPLTSS